MRILRQENGGVVLSGTIQIQDDMDLVIQEIIKAQENGRKIQILIEPPKQVIPIFTQN
jgi:hypothetical protein